MKICFIEMGNKMDNIKDELDDISLQLHSIGIHNKDELKNIRIQLETIEKKQRQMWNWMFWITALFVVILTNSGMMGQLWDFNFTEFFSFQLL